MYTRVPVESETNGDQCQANRDTVLPEAKRQRQLWQVAYAEHIVNAGNAVDAAMGSAKVVAQHQLDCLRLLASNPSKCDIVDTGVLVSA